MFMRRDVQTLTATWMWEELARNASRKVGGNFQKGGGPRMTGQGDLH